MQGMSEIQVRYALVWRGLALDHANVLEFSNHDKLIELLMDFRMQEPWSGYQRMKQLEAADKKFFVLLGEQTRAGIKSSAAGRPCDIAFDKVFNSAEFRHLLQPLAQAGQAPKDTPPVQALINPPKHQKLDPKVKGLVRHPTMLSSASQRIC